METFVLARVISGEVLDYLHQNGRCWTESPAHAKWYDSEEEAEEDREHWAHRYSVVQVLPYDPVQTLVEPSKVEHDAAVQEILRGELISK